MPLSLYQASVPGFLTMLRNLLAILEKAEAHARDQGTTPEALMDARLTTDMFPLTRQIQSASDAAKGGAARLAGMTPPSFADDETTYEQLKTRLAKTIAFIETIKPEQIDGGEERIIELKLPNRTMTFNGRDFLFRFALPNFMFHIVTAYGILRSRGAPIGKMDYLAGAPG